jgi:hypothetical protein
MASFSSVANNVWQHAEPSSYQVYHGEDPLTGLQNSLGMGMPNVPQNPGGDVGAANPNETPYLQPVPGTNFSYDPRTGQYYQSSMTDPRTGQSVPLGASTVAAAPNLAQQGSGDAVLQQMYVNQQQQALDRMNATRTGQNQLAQNYMATIYGGGPSIAGSQLQTGMNRIAQDQNSMAAGANGQNAFAARRAAAMATARAQGDLSGQLAIQRAQELQAARAGLAGLYGSESTADQAASNTAVSAGLGYGGLGERSEADRLAANQAAVNASLEAKKEDNNVKGSLLKGGGSIVSAFL